VAPPAPRRATWDALAGQPFDLLVIGGGITGAGVARDAAMRGLRVALVEKSDFGAGTSSKSSKLVHGGLRYLQHAAFGLVFEALSERALLLRRAPHLVRPLCFLVPAYKGQVPGLFTLDCGLWLYDAMSRFSSPRRHRTYRQRRILELEPGLHQNGLKGGIVYYDSMTDDARLTLENIIDAKAHGAQVASYACVEALLREGDAVRGARVRDTLVPGGATAEIRARVTINATGPWSDGILGLASGAPSALLRPTKGVHIVVDAGRLPVRHAVVMVAPQDGRVLFAIPWSDPEDGSAARTVIGTTDTDFKGDPDQVAADEADVDYLLTCANHYFPQARLQPQDILATWAGLRPLVAPQTEIAHASQVSREHQLLEQPGLITIAGGKLTTYRRMAAQGVDAALRQLGKAPRDLPCPTAGAPLPGAAGLPGDGRDGAAAVAALEAALRQLEHPAIDAQVARHLARTYGTRALALAAALRDAPAADTERLDPELPYLMAEVDLAVRQEEALRLEDVLARRLPLLLRGRDQGLACAGRVAARMAGLLGWTDARRDAEVERYGQVVALSRRFRS
jgi:glycerol-3-phosphate dehydrogenase